MSVTAERHAVATTPPVVRRAGRWAVAAGIVGIAQGAILLVWPAQVPDTDYSYPLTATGHVIAQATFFLQHLPLLVAVAVLGRTPWVRASRVARTAFAVATVGWALLAALEIVGMAAAEARTDSQLVAMIAGLYGPPVLLIAGGLLVGGIAAVRGGFLPTALGWATTAVGLYVFVVLLPILASGSFVAGRVGIMGWMALYAVLGALMARSE